MSKPIVFSPRSIAQLNALADVAGQYSATARTNLLATVADKTRLIEQQPEMYAVSAQEPTLRRCVITPHVSLYYRIQPAQVEVVGIVDSRRDPSALGLAD